MKVRIWKEEESDNRLMVLCIILGNVAMLSVTSEFCLHSPCVKASNSNII